jgi:hypothetical protein
MGVREWAELRLVEMLASLCAVGLLIAGLAAGLPFLTARIAEVFLYSICCISAVVLHAGIDLGFRGVRRLAQGVVSTGAVPAAREPSLEPAAA